MLVIPAQKGAPVDHPADILQRLGFASDGCLDLSRLGLSAAAIEARRQFIGGSDAPIIARGEGPELAALRAFKRGGPAPDLSQQLPVLMGLYTEPLNLALVERQLGLPVRRRGERLYDRARPWMACTLDGMLPDGRVVQAKHVAGWFKAEAILARYVPQLTHEMIVAGVDEALLSVIYGNHHHEIYPVRLDPLYAGQLVAAEAAFWDSVHAVTPPPDIPALAPPPPPPGPVVVDMTGSNAWADAAARYQTHQPAAELFLLAERELKDLLPAQASRAYGHGLEVRRSKNQARRVYPMTQEKSDVD